MKRLPLLLAPSTDNDTNYPSVWGKIDDLSLPARIQRSEVAALAIDDELFERYFIALIETYHDGFALFSGNIRIHENDVAILVIGFHGFADNTQRKGLGAATSCWECYPILSVSRQIVVHGFHKHSCLNQGDERHELEAMECVGTASGLLIHLIVSRHVGKVDKGHSERFCYALYFRGRRMALPAQDPTNGRLRYARLTSQCALCLQARAGCHCLS